MHRTLCQIRVTFAFDDVREAAQAALICDSLVHTRGVCSASLSLKTKTLKVKFDASVVSVQDVERLIHAALATGQRQYHLLKARRAA